MTRISFLNGQFIDHNQAFVHIEDRGMQFADGIYEVTLFYKNKLIDNDWHLERLFNSLNELNIKLDYTHQQLTDICLELFKRNNLNQGSVYIQITRGVAPRNQLLPQDIKPTVIMTVSSIKPINYAELFNGYSAVTMDDIRWKRCNIKSVGLLASSLCKQKATDLGYQEVIFIRDKHVTECSFSNLFIVDKDDNLVTKPLDNLILPGITRRRVIALAKSNNINVIEREITEDELLNAAEVFATSTTLLIRPLTSINDQLIGEGKCGDITRRLIDSYYNFIHS